MNDEMDDSRAVARLLWKGGDWDAALTALARDDHESRCEILLERSLFLLHEFDAVRKAIANVSDEVLSTYYQARLSYIEAVSSKESESCDLHPIREGLTAAMSHRRVKHWAVFWRGVVAEECDAEPEKAAAAYDRAFPMALHYKDIVLESCVVQRRGMATMEFDEDEGLRLLRRAFYLAATAGARPQAALAAMALSRALLDGPEATELREVVRRAAQELRSVWLLYQLDGTRLGDGWYRKGDVRRLTV